MRKPQIIWPRGGWKPHTWYLVRVMVAASNPEHHALFFTGFLDENGYPGNYSGLHPINCATDSDSEYPDFGECYYFNPISTLVTAEGELLKGEPK